MAEATKERERKDQSEDKATLPVGHAQAGYVSPDLSFHEGTGILPESEKEWHETRNEAREEGLKAVEENEDKVAKIEAEARDEWAEQAEKARDAQVAALVKTGAIAQPVPTPDQIAADKQAGGKAKSEKS